MERSSSNKCEAKYNVLSTKNDKNAVLETIFLPSQDILTFNLSFGEIVYIFYCTLFIDRQHLKEDNSRCGGEIFGHRVQS